MRLYTNPELPEPGEPLTQPGERELPPVGPDDPVVPDPEPLPLPPDTQPSPTAPVREPDSSPPPMGDPQPKEPTRLA